LEGIYKEILEYTETSFLLIINMVVFMQTYFGYDNVGRINNN
jgi:hypothetical protein